ncbi:MAG: hypothetical protein L0Z55_12310 [Planctomycetes bacterium]|nr:hypothetical protein [Planctomycetota bacterium]
MLSRTVIRRKVEPEWLDFLAPEDPAAAASRADLRRVNRLMGHAGIIAAELRQALHPATRALIEIGAGDGTLLLRALRRLGRQSPQLPLLLVDRQRAAGAETLAGFRALGWQPAVLISEAIEWLASCKQSAGSVFVANLFLHHFDEERLALLFERAAQLADCFIACEPRRSAFALGASHLLGAVGCNAVTRHDAVVSVHAGFNGRELCRYWPARDGWQLTERPAGLFSHLFVARRFARELPLVEPQVALGTA